MNIFRSPIAALSLLAIAVAAAPAIHAQQWTPPTPEELSMTSIPEVPGARSVILFQEQTTDDQLHMFSYYTRLKVLTELGKEDANVEIKYLRGTGDHDTGLSVDNVAGRTIHPDGTIIPFTGKPFNKLIQKGSSYKYQAKVFTLPSVEVGSIIEYRYKLHYEDNFYLSPDWYIQDELFVRRAHYLWKPTDKELTNSRDQTSSSVAWSLSLPPGAEVKQSRSPTGQASIELNVHDIPPVPHEDHMPPIFSSTYRVNFYYTSYRSAAEYWREEGKYWSKQMDKFIGPNKGVTEFVRATVTPADTSEQKLRKLYAAVMTMENTDFTRERSQNEDKSAGLGVAKNSDDILARKRGTGDQLAQLYVAMARAAGLKAYVMGVANRDRRLFSANYLSLNQLQDLIAIVNVDGKDTFFDPGNRYTPYGHLAWRHTYAQGLRQADGGQTALAAAPSEPVSYNRTARTANFTMDTEGKVSGPVKLTFSGEPALYWRHRSLRGDLTSVKKDMESALSDLLPGGMDIKIKTLDGLDDYEKPLVAIFDVSGGMGNATSTRLLLPSDVFMVNNKPAFTHEKRDIPIYFEYGEIRQDVMRIGLPPTFSIETLPKKEEYAVKGAMSYAVQIDSTPQSFTVRRDFVLGPIMYPATEYPTIRTFYNQFETKDQEPIVLKVGTVAAAGPPKGD